jgi:hypothetical protein
MFMDEVCRQHLHHWSTNDGCSSLLHEHHEHKVLDVLKNWYVWHTKVTLSLQGIVPWTTILLRLLSDK